jgi:hypothetical protein
MAGRGVKPSRRRCECGCGGRHAPARAVVCPCPCPPLFVRARCPCSFVPARLYWLALVLIAARSYPSPLVRARLRSFAGPRLSPPVCVRSVVLVPAGLWLSPLPVALVWHSFALDCICLCSFGLARARSCSFMALVCVSIKYKVSAYIMNKLTCLL